MQFSTVSAVLALAATAFAQVGPTKNFTPVLTPKEGEVVPAGSTYTITWQDTTGSPVTISLLGGASPGLLETRSVIASGVDSKAAKYAWAVDASLGKDATYGIQITLDSDKTIFQYGFPFVIKGSGASSNSSSSASASASASATKSASASASGYPTSTMTRMTTSAAASSTSTIYSASLPIANVTSVVPTTRATVVTLTSTAASQTSAAATSSRASSVPTAAAGRVAAGSLALVGGIAAAVFAL